MNDHGLATPHAVLIGFARDEIGHRSWNSDVMLLHNIQSRIAREASNHPPDCLFVRCARQVYSRPDLILRAFLEPGDQCIHELIGECTDQDPVPEPDWGQETEPQSHPGHPEVISKDTDPIIPLTRIPDVREKRRKHMKRVISDNLRDSFF